MLISCENDIEKVKSFESNENAPTWISEDIQIIYTDSALLKYIIKAPVIKRYDEKEEPYMEFPEGINVSYFDKNEELESVITANYAIYYESKALWEAKDDVETRNINKEEQLNTEQLFWNEKTGLIYSKKFTRIVNPDGTFYGEGGFEADQSFTWWKLKKVKESSVNYTNE